MAGRLVGDELYGRTGFFHGFLQAGALIEGDDVVGGTVDEEHRRNVRADVVYRAAVAGGGQMLIDGASEQGRDEVAGFIAALLGNDGDKIGGGIKGHHSLDGVPGQRRRAAPNKPGILGKGEEQREVRAGGSTRNGDAVRIEMQTLRIADQPERGFPDILDLGRIFCPIAQAVVHTGQGVTVLDQGKEEDIIFPAAEEPAAAVNGDYQRIAGDGGRSGREVKVERKSRVAAMGVDMLGFSGGIRGRYDSKDQPDEKGGRPGASVHRRVRVAHSALFARKGMPGRGDVITIFPMKRISALLLALGLCASAPLFAEISSREVSYKAGSVTAKGFLAIPEGKGKHPGVLVVHEWWGMDGYARKRASMLAELGYVALAVDMYGEGKVATHPKDAGAFAEEVKNNMPEARKRFEAALKFLQKQPEVDAKKIAAIGYCFGGGIVLQMAAEAVPGLDAVACFHGSLTAEVPKGVKPTASMLVCNGGADSFVTHEAIADFKKRMEAAGVDLTFTNYPGAKHGFTNPEADRVAIEFDLNVGYNAEADKSSWEQMQEFLKAAFRK